MEKVYRVGGWITLLLSIASLLYVYAGVEHSFYLYIDGNLISINKHNFFYAGLIFIAITNLIYFLGLYRLQIDEKVKGWLSLGLPLINLSILIVFFIIKSIHESNQLSISYLKLFIFLILGFFAFWAFRLIYMIIKKQK